MRSLSRLASAVRASVRQSPAVLLALLFTLVGLAMVAYLTREIQRIRHIALPRGQVQHNDLHAEQETARDVPAVLILDSYHRGYSWSDNEIGGMRDTLAASGRRLRTYVEYLDCKRQPSLQQAPELADLLRLKYPPGTVAMVIAADNAALEFALARRDELFPNVPLVFCGIDGFAPMMLGQARDVTGVAEVVDAAGTVELALRLHPRARRLVVFHDFTNTGLATRREAEAQLQRFSGRVAIEYWPEMSLDELTTALKSLPPDALVLALSYARDKSGRIVNHEQISHLLGENSPVPTYGLHEERVGYGVVGGRVLSGYMQGARAASMALQILGGTPVDRIPIQSRSPSRFMFDFTQLQRFGIPLAALPAESLVVNRPVSFVTEHGDVVVVAIGLVIILLAGIVVLLINIHRRSVAEERQRGLQAQLLQAQKMEAVGHLAGGVAHDFNNMLTAVMGFADLLAHQLPESHPGHALAQDIVSAAQRGAQLTRGLLAFSRRRSMNLQAIDVRTVVKAVGSMAKRLVNEDVVLDLRVPAEPVLVMADAVEMEHALINLYNNARDAMPQGGRLALLLEVVELSEERRQANLLEQAGRYAVLSVADTGVGMDEATRGRIFQPFFTTKEVGRGTGLGLSTVYGIVKQHHGAIECESAPGKGTCFRILLPCAPQGATAAAAPTRQVPRGGSESILLVEDDTAVRQMLSLTLRQAGYRVIEACDGEEAIQIFARNRESVALMLSDVIMPHRNGPDAYEAIRAQHGSVRVLFMTGHAPETLDGRARINGQAVLRKPVDRVDLLARVREALDSSVL